MKHYAEVQCGNCGGIHWHESRLSQREAEAIAADKSRTCYAETVRSWDRAKTRRENLVRESA